LPIYGRSKVIKQFYNWLIGASIIRNAGAAIAITETERPALEAAGAESDRVVVIPNGIDPDNYPKSDGEAFRRQHGLGDAPFVLFVGRLAPIKGPDLLLRAFCGLKDDFKVHRLVFAGPDVGMLAELTEIVAAHGLGDRVVFTGYLGGSAKNEALHAADLVVIPSRQEAMSIVVLEAGAAGTPVLVTDQCGCDDIMGGERGLVVPATVDGLQSGMKQLLDDRSRLAVKGETLRRYVLERYAWDSLILKYVAIYTRLTPGVA
jgi:glycosyltransferase involved in cell wall biosynthesis